MSYIIWPKYKQVFKFFKLLNFNFGRETLKIKPGIGVYAGKCKHFILYALLYLHMYICLRNIAKLEKILV